MSRRTIGTLSLTVLVGLALLPLSGCSSASDPGKGGKLEGIQWKLTNYLAADTLEDVQTGTDIFAEFKDGRVSGKALNSYSAEYTAKDDGSLTIGQISSTLMAVLRT